MRILLIVGSKQIDGNTDALADSFIQGAQKAKHTVEKVHLRKFMVNPCLGCNMCFQTGKACIQNDDMDKVYELFKSCDMIVLATPLFFWQVSSALKAVIDRLYAVCNQDFKQLPKKDIILLATAHDTKPDTFYQLSSYYKTVFINNLGWRDRGMILAAGCGGVKEEKHIKNTRFLADAERLGASL